jgi:hypothetical protein
MQRESQFLATRGGLIDRPGDLGQLARCVKVQHYWEYSSYGIPIVGRGTREDDGLLLDEKSFVLGGAVAAAGLGEVGLEGNVQP